MILEGTTQLKIIMGLAEEDLASSSNDDQEEGHYERMRFDAESTEGRS